MLHMLVHAHWLFSASVRGTWSGGLHRFHSSSPLGFRTKPCQKRGLQERSWRECGSSTKYWRVPNRAVISGERSHRYHTADSHTRV